MMKRWGFLFGICLLGLAACGHDHDHDGDEHLYCQGDEDTLAANLTRLGDQGIFNVTILDWSPDPLFVGNNSFTIRVTDTSDVPVDGLTLDAETWQRIHDHGTPVEAIISPLQDTGEFQVDDMNVLHTGSWLFRFAPSDGTSSDLIEFNFGVQCPPEAP